MALIEELFVGDQFEGAARIMADTFITFISCIIVVSIHFRIELWQNRWHKDLVREIQVSLTVFLLEDILVQEDTEFLILNDLSELFGKVGDSDSSSCLILE